MRMQPAVTFRGLLAALRLCPHLDTLRIFMDAVNVDIDPTTESFQNTTLQKLDLTQSDVANVEDVARIIFSILPGVDRVSTPQHHWNTSVVSKKWDEVNGHLEKLKS
ncbi:hypothetical protein EDB19DRAFT_1700420 [Suillus lakei]|nr:hypothetical protein EDB19DRAFT_1700420 [Suillus lakei]